MSDSGDIRCSFTIEEIGKDDPRLKQLREIREEEQQAGFHAMIKLIPGTGELKIENVDIWNQFHLTEEDFNRLKSLGLKGSLRVTGWGALGYAPYKARTLIVARHQIKEAVDLPQPDDCEIIYYQMEDDEWRKFPPEAPVWKKRFRLSIDRANKNLTNMWVEAYFGSETGSGGGFNWERLG